MNLKMNSDYELYSDFININLNCDYLLINSKLELYLSTECMKCIRKRVCEKYCYIQNMNSDVKHRTKQSSEQRTEQRTEILKLNCETVYVSSRKRKFRRKFKNIDLTKVKVLKFDI